MIRTGSGDHGKHGSAMRHGLAVAGSNFYKTSNPPKFCKCLLFSGQAKNVFEKQFLRSRLLASCLIL